MTSAKQQISRWLLPLAACLGVVLGVWLHAPSLSAGLYADDYLQDAMLAGDYPVQRSAFDVYNFSETSADRDALIERGVLPWWSHPDLKLMALRPLASASLALDYRLGLSATTRHAVSLGWLCLLIICVAAWYRKFLPPAAAALGVLAFAVDPAHVSPTGWLANRTALMCGVFGVLALIATFRFLEAPNKRTAALVCLCLALALGSGEYGLCAVGIALPWLLLARRDQQGHLAGADSATADPRVERRVRLQALACWLGPTAVYLGLHSALGYGAVGSSVYVNLAASPQTFGVALVSRLPALLVSEVLLLPSEFLHGALVISFGPTLFVLALLTAGVAAACWYVLRRTEACYQAVGRALAAGLVLSLIPLVATLPSARLLVLPSVAGAGLLGLFVWRASLSLIAGSWVKRLGLALLLVPALLLHLVVAPLGTRQIARGVAQANARSRAAMQNAQIPADAPVWLLLNAQDFSLTSLPWVRHAAGAALPRSVWLLTSTDQPLVFERTGPRSFRLQVERGAMLNQPAPFLYRSIEAPLKRGEVVARPGLRVVIEEPLQFGYKRLSFELDHELQDPSLVFLNLNPQGHLVRVAPPKIGKKITLPPSPRF